MLRIKAPAKINLSLNVLGKQGDFHDVEMVMTTIDLADYVSISIAPHSSRKITITTDNTFIPNDENNIAHRAAAAFMDHFDLSGHVKIVIEKNIPISSGLAGGSSNAAAVLKGLREAFEIDCSTEELCEIGATIGSDVPFCIVGKTALATGRGEIITPITSVPPCWSIIINPRIPASTQDIYGAFNLATAERIDTNEMLKAIENKDFNAICQHLANDLESVTIPKYPVIGHIKSKLRSAGANGVLMSGSGTTVFGLVYTEKKAIAIYHHMKATFPQYIVHLVRVLG